VPVAAAAWAAALAATRAPDAAATIAAVLWVATCVVLLVASRRPSPRMTRAMVVCVLLLAAGAVTASHVALAHPTRERAAQLPVQNGRALEMSVVVTGKVERREGDGIAFDARAVSVSIGGTTTALDVPVVVRLSADELPPGLDMGARVVLRGTAVAGETGRREVLVVHAARGAAIVEHPAGILAATAALRGGLVRSASALPGPGAGLVPGLAVGDTWAVDPALDAAMKESSLSHLTAVSGANCALVVAIAFGLAAVLGAPRSVRIAVALATLVAFVVLVTPEPSVVRAAAMAAIAMLALALGRPAAGIGILSCAVSILLMMDPWLSGSLGFALSAAATASLLLAARPLARGLERHLPRVLALALSVPIAAQLACGPLLVLITPSVPVYGVLANLLAGLAAPPATVLGLLACVSAPLPWLRDGLTALAWVPASWIAATAQQVSALPGDLAPWWEGWPGAAALALVGLAVGVLIAMRPSDRRGSRVVRGAAGLLVAVTLGVGVGTVALGGVAGAITLPVSWTVLACDVGQGDAVLLRSGGAVALVDTGPDPEVLGACLDRVGIQRIDLLVLTHYDLDHAGGATALLGRVGVLVHGPPTTAADRMLLARLEAEGATLRSGVMGLTGSLGDARWRVLWPRGGGHAYPSGNDASVVLDVRGGGIPPLILLGDLSKSPQSALAASGSLDPPYAVVKFAHHGSADQDASLYELIAPALAIVSVGADNGYGHPRAEALDIAAEAGARIARTDRAGIVAVWLEGARLRVWGERGGVEGAG
jgi:competence protein ComEC